MSGQESPWVFTVNAPDTRYGPDTVEPSDSLIMAVPARWYCDLPDDAGRALVGPLVAREMRELSARSAERLGERLHHAEWVITADPGKVREIGMTHDCADCLAGTEAAVAWLDAHPGGELAAALLWWAAHGPPGNVTPGG